LAHQKITLFKPRRQPFFTVSKNPLEFTNPWPKFQRVSQKGQFQATGGRGTWLSLYSNPKRLNLEVWLAQGIGRPNKFINPEFYWPISRDLKGAIKKAPDLTRVWK